MTVEFVSPVGRLVQGGFDPQTTDSKGAPLVIKTGPNAGQPTQRYFLALAIAKTDPAWPEFYAKLVQEAKAGYPQYFQAGSDTPTHPRFTFKIADGDGLDNNGNPNSAKEGFAGHWVVKFSSSFAPKCFHAGKYDPAQQIQNPQEVIKRGYYIRVAGNAACNIGSDVPGLYMNHNMVEFVAYGQEIVGGPDAGAVFGSAGAAALPPGATAAPQSAPSPMGGASVPTPPTPPAPHTPPTPPAPPAPPAPPQAGPTYTMTPAAQGATREALHGSGWTDELLVEHGYMIIS